jgi:hypothetical protein
MNKITSIILGILAFGLLLDSSSKMFRWTLSPGTTTINEPGFIETMTNSIAKLPLQLVGFSLYFVAKLLEAIIKMVCYMIPLIGSKMGDRFEIKTDAFEHLM